MTKTTRQPLEIAILVYPDCASATVFGLTDLFMVASNRANPNGKTIARRLRVSHWQARRTDNAIECVYDTHPDLPHNLVVVIVPGSWSGEPQGQLMHRLVRFLLDCHAKGSTLCSVCGGAFILAQTGLLAGRVATTHWDYLEKLSERFPDVQVDERRIVVEDGNIITTGGVLAWADLGLKLVDRHLGSAVMLETARYMLMDPPGREQRFYSTFSPKLHHGDRAILKVQHWLQMRATAQPTIPQMAAIASLAPRTFLRRFEKATGLKPTDYCQRLRVGKARELLELSVQKIDQIAARVGYGDPASFRKVFQRVVGMTPTDYRRRFSAT